MFHRQTDASKVAFVALVERLRARGFTLLDAQVLTEHLASLGCVAIRRDEFLDRLAAAQAIEARFGDE
jgi:leucyl/phenylalanyl-tRNA--protein transferase